jgi:TolA-binding protein
MKKLILVFFILCATTVFAIDPSEYFEYGKNAYQNGKYSLAVDFFKKTLALKPERDLKEKTLYYLSLSFYYNEEYKNSIEYILKFLNEYPQSVYREQLSFILGANYYKLKDYESALARLRKYLLAYPDGRWELDARILIGYSLLFINQYPQAIEEWNGILKKFPSGQRIDEVTLRLGQSYFYDENYEKSKNTLKNFSSKFPLSPYKRESEFFLGKSFYFLNQYDEALNTFSSISNYRSFVYYEDVVYFIAMCYLQKKDYAKSESNFVLLTNSTEYFEEANYKLGLIYRITKDYSSSITCLKRVIEKKSTKSNKAVLELATTFIEIGNYSEALRNLNELTKSENEDTPYAYQKIGEIFLLQKNYPFAISNFSVVLNKYPSFANRKEILFLRGKAYSAMKNYESAKRDLEEYISLLTTDEEKSQALFFMGNVAFENGKYEEANEYYSGVLNFKNITNRDEIQNLIALSYFNQGNYFKSKEAYLSLIKNYPASEYIPLAYYNLGIIEYNNKNYGEAINYFEKVYKNYKESGYAEDAILKTGWIYYKEEKFKILANYLDKFSAEIKNKKWEYENLKGWAYFRLGDYTKAISSFEQSLAFAKDLASSNETYTAIAKSYYNMNEFNKAFRYYSMAYDLLKANSMTGELPSLISDIAWTLVKMGKMDDAKKYYEKLVTEFPESKYTSEGLLKIAEYYYNLSDFKTSLSYYTKVLELATDKNYTSLATYWIGWCYINQNNKLEALKYFERYIENFPDGEYIADVLLRTGLIYYEFGNTKQAKESLQTLIKKYPKSYEAEKASSLLDEINLVEESKGDVEKYYTLLIKKARTKDEKASLMLKLADYYKEGGKKDKAIETYKEILKLSKKDEAAIATVELGFYDIEDNNYKEAIEKFSKVFNVYKYSPLYPKALYGISISYYNQGEVETAKKYFKRLEENYPDSEWTKKAKEIIK